MEDTRGRVTKDGIRIYEDAHFAGMQIAGRVAAEILDQVCALVRPGVTTAAIDDFIREEIERRGVTSATIGYKGYQHASCISVNHVVCHGIPGAKIPGRSSDVLQATDILNVDVTVIVDGWFGDTSRMYVAGTLPRKAERLIEITHESLMRGQDRIDLTAIDAGAMELRLENVAVTELLEAVAEVDGEAVHQQQEHQLEVDVLLEHGEQLRNDRAAGDAHHQTEHQLVPDMIRIDAARNGTTSRASGPCRRHRTRPARGVRGHRHARGTPARACAGAGIRRAPGRWRS